MKFTKKLKVKTIFLKVNLPYNMQYVSELLWISISKSLIRFNILKTCSCRQALLLLTYMTIWKINYF